MAVQQRKLCQVYYENESGRRLLEQIAFIDLPVPNGLIIFHHTFGERIVLDSDVIKTVAWSYVWIKTGPAPDSSNTCSKNNLAVQCRQTLKDLAQVLGERIMPKKKTKAQLLAEGDRLAVHFERRQSAEYLARSVPAWWKIINIWRQAGLTATEIKTRAADRFKTTPPAELIEMPTYINERLLKRIGLAAQFLEEGGQLDEGE